MKKGLLGREEQGRAPCFLHSSPRNIPTRLVMLCCKTTVNHLLLRERALSPLDHLNILSCYVFLFRLFGGSGGTVFLII